MDGYFLSIANDGVEQHDGEHTFIGGIPRLPAGNAFPICHLCGSQQTFFCQFAVPEDHPRYELSLAVFACTQCENEDHLIPKMPDGGLHNIDLNSRFFEGYEINCNFMAFCTVEGVPRMDYQPKVKFKRWHVNAEKPKKNISQIGGYPIWILGNEAPATYEATTPFSFLLQIEANVKYELVPEAPPQMVIDYYSHEGTNKPSSNPYYELFIGNALYLFGAQLPEKNVIYAVVQK